MLIAAVLSLAVALLGMPACRGRARLRALRGSRRDRRGGSAGRGMWPGAALVVICIGSGLVLGPAGAGVAAALGLLVWRRQQVRGRERARQAALRGLSVGLATLVAELRSGTHPASAAEAAAEDASGSHRSAGAVLRSVAALARLGGDVEAALSGMPATGPVPRRPLVKLANAWRLAQGYGVPLADVLEAVRGDLDAVAGFTAQHRARMAGPRTSVLVLAALPLLGLALGQFMGARPLDVLGSTAQGQLLLVLGGALLCAGLAWSARLTRAEVRL
ncbi:type II secretion system F family protein [Haloechinothrix sp. YIM 98757]|uniref:Type II secretion system F family protein n=1 Tax=Haloechinothrix aidingensis TaxID=2752311 RepID=A0A838AE07_9PSEU|nr:type II secretion system F family protein [Haloechinothrix aidingensis]MBA0127385.1 type II secretion system F family protein [Haloechinothrix aidingensis]